MTNYDKSRDENDKRVAEHENVWKPLTILRCHLAISMISESMIWVLPPPRIPVANEALGWDPRA